MAAATPSVPAGTGTPPPRDNRKRVGSFLGWAFLISLVIHGVAAPFIGLKHREDQQPETTKISEIHKIKVAVHTPPPPTPTPPPPTPPPKRTPPPVKQTAPPPQPKLKINPPKTTDKSVAGPNSEAKYVPPPVGNQNGNPQGTEASGPPVPTVSTAKPETPAPTPVPTPTPTPKPQCANPNAAAVATVQVPPDYPDIARQQGVTGVTQVKVTLDASGGVAGTTIYKSSGNAALDNSAVAAAKASKYSPETVNCVKTGGSYIFRAEFDAQ